ncbi:MAG: bifunctional proline dehydrogenase/L-glutamate gamma-semialdehyde dehydrogenase PutA [Nevskiales bacterium]|nr:bifunctional proline dehydrogenase/L-glutamate gamma-semialdehyde dehydrogenase PutA [Nevskiales bacterium]
MSVIAEPSRSLWVDAEADAIAPESPQRAAVSRHFLAEEAPLVQRLAVEAQRPPEVADAVCRTAAAWVERVRGMRDRQSALDAFMRQYDLSSEEGVLLMCLAEALLRIPDDETAERLIADKLAPADWAAHLGRSESLFVNASTWGLMLTGRIVRLSPQVTTDARAALNRLIGRSTEPVIRLAIRQAMRMMGSQFVMGRSIEAALRRAASAEHRHELHSYDMLGEAALTARDAARYGDAYERAIIAVGTRAAAPAQAGVSARPGISVKLSALHPRYVSAQRGRVLRELTPRLRHLLRVARDHGVGLTLDAEEAERLELSMDLFERVLADPVGEDWDGFGLAVQAFQKRAPFVIEWLDALARAHRRRIPVRLVKGAYWDSEIKRAQELGLSGYPVFTRKRHTDVAYLACARRLLAAPDAFYPMFATHNAHTIAAVRSMANEAGCGADAYEFQRLHGMGAALYQVVGAESPVRCRVYAPVGSHEDLLPYLVRRLLENGANTSFVNRIFDEQVPALTLVADPVAAALADGGGPHPHLPLPEALYGVQRRNSTGLDLSDRHTAFGLRARLSAVALPTFARSVVADGIDSDGMRGSITDPADRRRVLGAWAALPPASLDAVLVAAQRARMRWDAAGVESRAAMLESAADRIEAQRPELMALLVREAGKTLPDALAEVREAVDFLRYYAATARGLMRHPQHLPGPTGESNELSLHGRGVFVCISPWNFPLAIFTGQVAAALVTGNCVIAKPAEQTNLIAMQVVKVLHEAGVPSDVLQLVLGDGALGAALVAARDIAGVAFTGSVETAQAINRALAARSGPIAALIAETGGQNAMIVDSSALPEQVVRDAMHSAFGSAGQRCSALRVLCLQREIADRVLAMLGGAMRELRVGDPGLLATDVGPVIDPTALRRLQEHAAQMRRDARVVEQLDLPAQCAHGTYFAPMVVELDDIARLDREHFGPILHVLRYHGQALEALVDRINATDYGLTLGVHTRIESTWRRVQARARVGNCYVNRGMTGAIVGCQPFGGEGLSGTGPKAGGPHYLLRFVVERALSVNTAAVGGNATLLAADDG